MKSSLLKSFCLLMIASGVFCTRSLAQATQGVTIRGQVIDKKDRQAIIGASVIEFDKDHRTVTGVTTDINGNYAIKISNPNNQLSVSYIGYKTFLSGSIGDRRQINVLLESSENNLNTVNIVSNGRSVNTGTGLNIDVRNSTLATATVNAKDLEELQVSSIDQALAGRMPGVDFGSSSGDPGAGMTIRIRGTASITGNAEPLIVLDGMPYETQIPADFNFGTADDQQFGQLLNIAPTDIKDITVLKDAAATAVWGSKAANGVLIINTKRGQMGKPVVTYNFRGTASKQPKSIPMLNGDQYATLIPEEFMNATGVPLDFLGNNGQNKAFQHDPLDAYYYYNYSNNTDWIGLITRVAYTQDHNISMSGGGEKARYYASVGYLNQGGTTLGTDLNRITAKINLDYVVSNKLRFRTDLTYTHINNSLNYDGSLRSVAYNKMPNMAPYAYDEYGNITSVYFSPASNIQGKYPDTYNPLALANTGVSHLYGDRITPHFTLQYDMLPSLLVSTVDVQFDVNNSKSKTFLPQIATGLPSTDKSVNATSDNDGDSYNVQSKINFIYTPNLGDKHNLQALLSLQTNETNTASYTSSTANTASSFLQDPTNATEINPSLNSVQGLSRSVGVLLQGQYSFLDRYIISVNGRVDGNSKFGPNNRYGFFPGVASRWRISDERFMKSFKFLSELSLRLSYGASGEAPDASYYGTYTPFNATYNGVAAVAPSNIQLSSLKWQTLIGKNLGINLGLFNNRVIADAEFYQNTTKDLFYQGLAIPSSNGFQSVDMNIGTVDNNGWEVSLNTVPIKTKRLIVGFDFNIARNANSITSVSDDYPRESSVGVPGLGKYKSYLIIGNPFGSYYGFKYKGVYKDKTATIATDENGRQIIGPNGQVVYMRYNYPQVDYTFQPGDAMYEDINHDGNIDYRDLVYLGNGIPKFVGGFGPTITIGGNFSLKAYFNFRWGYDIVNGAKITTTNMYGVNNQSTAVLRRWRNPGDVTDIPRALYGAGYNWLGSDRYVEDASFVRLASVTARYNLPKLLLQKLKLHMASIYLTSQNLATWTNYTGQNPDVSTVGSVNPFSYPVDNALTPPAIQYTVGVTIGF
ncbi:SusC/RagA family TonB-linked outer membrane protein [Mucilaginibacter sp. PPCGB 2223]|uniref:SusC/RagA family TonB-linked outer membrane protein n=1 Tax=Mucilaginibacter sp. PPCGB 2223 TaxID=1886027 RepID=UPI000826CACC|nr:SusC/RagA family TonB-linked outer membrane protein [Mucilaginibacter sp. PPCGB 2223]OCX52133.1 SusC/RagA family TonB-linked outer membrane protein [Mucilaginibacter sp. PPCGB 2223]